MKDPVRPDPSVDVGRDAVDLSRAHDGRFRLLLRSLLKMRARPHRLGPTSSGDRAAARSPSSNDDGA